MDKSTIQVWFNNGEALQPWHVGLHDGVAIAETFHRFADPITAINYALDSVSPVIDLPVKWPSWLKVVLN